MPQHLHNRAYCPWVQPALLLLLLLLLLMRVSHRSEARDYRWKGCKKLVNHTWSLVSFVLSISLRHHCLGNNEHEMHTYLLF